MTHSPRFFPRVSQRAIRCDRGESLIPGFNRTRQLRAQLLNELQSFIRGFSNLAAHVPRNPDNHFVDLALTNDFCDSINGRFARLNCLQGMREHSQLIRNRESDASAAEIDSQDWIHGRESDRSLLQFGWKFAHEILDFLRVVPVANENRVAGADDNEVVDAEQRDRGFAIIKDNVIAGVERSN